MFAVETAEGHSLLHPELVEVRVVSKGCLGPPLVKGVRSWDTGALHKSFRAEGGPHSNPEDAGAQSQTPKGSARIGNDKRGNGVKTGRPIRTGYPPPASHHAEVGR